MRSFWGKFLLLLQIQTIAAPKIMMTIMQIGMMNILVRFANSEKKTDFGCVSTQSQNRDSKAGFEIRVFTTRFLKKILSIIENRTHPVFEEGTLRGTVESWACYHHASGAYGVVRLRNEITSF